MKNNNSKILDRLSGTAGNMKFFTAPNGMTVSFPIVNGELDIGSVITINGTSLPLKHVLHAVEIARLAGTGGRCVCPIHGAYKATSMGCNSCRSEISSRAASLRDNTYEDDAES